MTHHHEENTINTASCTKLFMPADRKPCSQNARFCQCDFAGHVGVGWGGACWCFLKLLLYRMLRCTDVWLCCIFVVRIEMVCCQWLHPQLVVFKKQRSLVCEMLAMEMCEFAYPAPAKCNFNFEAPALRRKKSVKRRRWDESKTHMKCKFGQILAR